MERLKEQGDDVLHPSFVAAPVTVAVVKKVAKKAKKVEVVMTDSAVTRKYTMEDVVRLGSTVEAPWFVVHGEVYDGKAFLDKHPGGSESITIVKGADATEDFMAIHSSVSSKVQRTVYVTGLTIYLFSGCESKTRSIPHWHSRPFRHLATNCRVDCQDRPHLPLQDILEGGRARLDRHGQPRLACVQVCPRAR